jgi:hypothetical protein
MKPDPIPEEYMAVLELPKVGKHVADIRRECEILWLIRELMDAQGRLTQEDYNNER